MSYKEQNMLINEGCTINKIDAS